MIRGGTYQCLVTNGIRMYRLYVIENTPTLNRTKTYGTHHTWHICPTNQLNVAHQDIFGIASLLRRGI